MKLKYKAALHEGKIVEGYIEAKDSKEAAFFLRKKNLVPITIEVVKEKNFFSGVTFIKKYKINDLIFFTRQLSSMLMAGLTLMQALTILKDQIQNDTLKEVVRDVIREVEDGKTFTTAIAKYPKMFSPVYISLVSAGEYSGFLEKILLRLAENLEKEQKLRSTLRSALMYPMIVISLMVIVMSLMMIFVIPKLTGLYENVGISLPLVTQIVIGISNFMVSFWPFLLGGIVVGGFFYTRWSKTDTGKHIVDTWMLKLPIFGKLIRQTIVAEISRTLGLLIGSGTLITQSLQETAEVAGNTLFKHAMLDIAQNVEKGVSIGNAMANHAIFPPLLIEMVKIGEQTGKLDDSLLRVSEYFEREVALSVKTLTTAMEPIIMIILGIGVAFLVIAVIIPIYGLISSIK